MNVTEVTCYKCGNCGSVFISEEYAEKCCRPKHCEKCGAEMPHNSYYTLCEKCRAEKEATKEKERFEKAKHYTFDNVPQSSIIMLYSDSYGENEGYFDDLEQLEDYCEENDIEMPGYVWGTRCERISMDAGSIIENACEELHEDAYDWIGKESEEELQETLNKWCEKQSGTDTYYVDYKVAIILKEGE